MISVIGAGPIGCYAASLLGKKDDITVYEQKETVGKPVQCTGIVTSTIDNVVDIKHCVVNKVDTIKIIAPNKKFIDVHMKNPNYILDREILDSHFFNKAVDGGVNFEFGAKFKDYRKGKLLINKTEIKTDVLIGADGPFSRVARKTDLYGDRKMMTAMQYRVKGQIEQGLVEIHLGYGCFGWVVPESDNTARVGVIDYKPPGIYLNKLLGLKEYKLLENQSGMVPVYNPKLKTQKNNVFLIGDAATQVKAATHGGLISGLMAAQELSKSFRDYEKKWKKRIGKELWFSLMIRKRLDRYDNNKYNKLIEMFRKRELKDILENIDRDYPSKLILKLLLREPRLLGFI